MYIKNKRDSCSIKDCSLLKLSCILKGMKSAVGFLYSTLCVSFIIMKRKIPLGTILKNLDDLYDTHVHVRSHFPFIGPDLIGSSIIPSKAFYEFHGYSYDIHLNEKITHETADLFNKRSHWLNQNVIVRLFAFLNSYQFVGDENSKIEIDFNANGSTEVDFVRRLRNIFAHASGFYNKRRNEHRRLLKEIKESYKLDPNIKEFPLSINTVIEPLFEGCKNYIIEKY